MFTHEWNIKKSLTYLTENRRKYQSFEMIKFIQIMIIK